MALIRLLAVVLTLSLITQTSADPIDVWLDVDPGNGLVLDGRPRDVDDGITMLQAFHSPELRVRGVGVVFGNAPLENALPVAHEITRRFGPEGLGVYSGAASGDDLGAPTDATRALIAELQQRELTVLALGPVTNIATVVRDHPELRERIKTIVVVAGRRPGFGFHPPGRPELIFPDANFEKDVPGMQVLLDSNIPILFAGYELSSDVWLTRNHIDALKTAGAVGAWIHETSQAWLARWEARQQIGFNPFDTLAVEWVIAPDRIESIPVRARIAEGPDDRATPEQRAAGKTKHYLICEPDDNSPHRYGTKPADGFIDRLVKTLATPPQR